MSEDELVLAMQPFGQAGSHLVRSQAGTGLGLPLVKAFMDLLGGEFHIQSEVNVGTEISLIFPAS
jgi:two-component system cell cycle sensor histidine kinase PleC